MGVDITRNQARLSSLFASMLADDDDEDSDDILKIPLLDVDFDTLTFIAKFMKYHEKDPPFAIERPLKVTNFEKLVSKFDLNLFNVRPEFLNKIILAACFIDCKSLLDVAMCKLATRVANNPLDAAKAGAGIKFKEITLTGKEDAEVRKIVHERILSRPTS